LPSKKLNHHAQRSSPAHRRGPVNDFGRGRSGLENGGPGRNQREQALDDQLETERARQSDGAEPARSELGQEHALLGVGQAAVLARGPQASQRKRGDWACPETPPPRAVSESEL